MGGQPPLPRPVATAVVRVKWQCSRCHRRWCERVCNRTDAARDTGCPGCASRLADVQPSIAAEWDADRNRGLSLVTAASVPAVSVGRFWWRCSICDGTWCGSPAGRVSGAETCPTCLEMASGRRDTGAAPNTNRRWCRFCGNVFPAEAPSCPCRSLDKNSISDSVARKRPELLAGVLMASEREQDTIRESSVRSSRLVTWRCDDCRHPFRMSIRDRCMIASRCPQCLANLVSHKASHPTRLLRHFPIGKVPRNRVPINKYTLDRYLRS